MLSVVMSYFACTKAKLIKCFICLGMIPAPNTPHRKVALSQTHSLKYDVETLQQRCNKKILTDAEKPSDKSAKKCF